MCVCVCVCVCVCIYISVTDNRGVCFVVLGAPTHSCGGLLEADNGWRRGQKPPRTPHQSPSLYRGVRTPAIRLTKSSLSTSYKDRLSRSH